MFTKVFSNLLWRQKSAPHQATYEGYLPYFNDDRFPLAWHKLISESPSATSCVSTISDFMEGFGFSNTELEKVVVNTKSETFFNIHHKTCQSFAEFEGFYWHFSFDAQGKISEWNFLPFESCRLGKADDNGAISKIYYNPFYGTDEYASDGAKRKNTKIYDTFNLAGVKDQIRKEGNKYKGQVLFIGTTTAASRFYPYPEATSASKWMGSEAGISDYHEDNINNGLLQPYILIMKGDPNQPSTNPEYTSEKEPITVGEEFNQVISKNFQGAKRVGNVMVQWVNNPDEKPEVLALPTNASGDLFVTLDNQATKKITVAFKVPAILANIQEGVSLGGDGNMIRVAVKLMQQRVIKKQRIITDAYDLVLKNMSRPIVEPVVIVPYNPYPELEVLDDKIWDTLTDEEKRKWINDNTEVELIDTTVATPDQPAQASIKNAIPVGFPDKVKETVRKALEYDDKMGTGCGTKSGRNVAQMIMDNQSIGQRQLKRIYNYLKKRPEMANGTFDDCEVVLYNQWGGKEMELFLESKLKELDSWLN